MAETNKNLGARFTFPGTAISVNQMGYGAMQLSGPGVFGAPKDRAAALNILRTAVDHGVNHIDTSDYYGPHITNQIICEALYPYPKDLVIVSKVGAKRDEKGGWLPAITAEDIIDAVHDNLRHLKLDALDIVNLRSMHSVHGPAEGSMEEPLAVLNELKQQGFIKHIGLSNVTRAQIDQAQLITPIVCVQNHYNIVHRHDDELILTLAEKGIAFVPFFPLGGFTPLQSTELTSIAHALGASPMQVALAWLMQRSPNMLLIPGTSSIDHLMENLAAGAIKFSKEILTRLNSLT